MKGERRMDPRREFWDRAQAFLVLNYHPGLGLGPRAIGITNEEVAGRPIIRPDTIEAYLLIECCRNQAVATTFPCRRDLEAYINDPLRHEPWVVSGIYNLAANRAIPFRTFIQLLEE